MKNKNNFQKGYIALVSAVIISLLLMAITFALNFSSYFSRFNITDSSTKEMSQSLAESCLDKALLSLAQNSSYAGNENVVVNGTETCSILPLTASSSQKIIQTSATFQKTATNMKAVVNLPAFTIASWEETP